MKETTNYKLNQWALTDRVRMEDFNADNAKIEAALTELSGGLAGTLGKAEHILTWESDHALGSSRSKPFPAVNWDDWEYICALVIYPEECDQTIPLSLIIGTGFNNVWKEQVYKNLAMPGYMVVYLPRHDGSRNLSGFLLANRFAPFSLDRPFTSAQYFQTSTGEQTYFPKVVFLGGK